MSERGVSDRKSERGFISARKTACFELAPKQKHTEFLGNAARKNEDAKRFSTFTINK